MTASAEFPATPESIAAARRFVAANVGTMGEDERDAVALMVSELATNSVRHARTPYRVEVRRRDGTVRVAVSDTGTGLARVREPSPRDPHGRGLRVVNKLADAWGVEVRPQTPGKTTWFTLRVESIVGGPTDGH
jgi:anti-sigma regulatory factor (Ser/Thr protein kinase)